MKENVDERVVQKFKERYPEGVEGKNSSFLWTHFVHNEVGDGYDLSSVSLLDQATRVRCSSTPNDWYGLYDINGNLLLKPESMVDVCVFGSDLLLVSNHTLAMEPYYRVEHLEYSPSTKELIPVHSFVLNGHETNPIFTYYENGLIAFCRELKGMEQKEQGLYSMKEKKWILPFMREICPLYDEKKIIGYRFLDDVSSYYDGKTDGTHLYGFVDLDGSLYPQVYDESFGIVRSIPEDMSSYREFRDEMKELLRKRMAKQEHDQETFLEEFRGVCKKKVKGHELH